MSATNGETSEPELPPVNPHPIAAMLEDLCTALKTLAFIAFAIFCLLSIPFIIAHIIDSWDAPEYPHSGFTPDCPTWEEPYEKPSIVNRQW